MITYNLLFHFISINEKIIIKSVLKKYDSLLSALSAKNKLIL